MKKYEALITAGGKGTRMLNNGIEKPMLAVCGKPTVMHMVSALENSKHISSILVSVSSNTPQTERYLKDRGIETILTSGESYMDDLHTALNVMSSETVMTAPSDLPLLSPKSINFITESFRPDMGTMIAVVRETTLSKFGLVPSFSADLDGETWALTGINMMDRVRTLNGEVLDETFLKCDFIELAVNMNTVQEFRTAVWLSECP
ncbi:MAG: NTP transferase domain-containing protein [Candidatus Methanomethylophilaceae archaeon]|jgi:adenosylcobinamide-phosphate guanylyltransferase